MNAKKGQMFYVGNTAEDLKIYYVVKANDRYKYPFLIVSQEEYSGDEENVVFLGTSIDCELFVRPINDRIDRLSDAVEQVCKAIQANK